MEEKNIIPEELVGKELYWGLEFKKVNIIIKDLKKKIDSFIDFICFLVGVSGLLSLFYFFFLKRDVLLVDYTEFFFWNEKSPFVLFFFISLIFVMFVVYRMEEKHDALKKITYSKNIKNNVLERDLLHPRTPKIKRLNVSSGYSDNALKVVEESYLIANKLKQNEISTKHLFRALLTDKKVISMFIRLNVDLKALANKINSYLVNPDLTLNFKGETVFSEATKKVLNRSYISAFGYRQKAVEALNMVLPCLQEDKILSEILYDFEIDDNKIINVVEWFRLNEKMIEDYRLFRKMASLKPGTGMNRSFTAIATPTLDYFSYDLTISAKYGRLEMCVTRDKEMEAIFQAFASGQYGVLLVGENGVGKRTIIEGLAQLMVKEEVPKFFQDKRLAEIDLSRLISGASPAEAQERLLSCINEALISGNVILYIENLQNIMGISSGGEGSLDLSEVLANAIKSQGLYCLATINRESYTKHVEDKSLGDIMTTVGVSEPVNDQAIQMIESKVGFWEGKHKVYFSYDAIEQAVKMTSRYFNDKFLPEKAINILTATAVKVAQRRAKDGRGPLCSKEEVAEVISDITKIPVNKITQKEGEKLLHLEAVIHERMIDQEEAVSAVASSLRRARTELRESKRPIASFLFLGPTGVGKTELAKSVADVYFGDENAMVRLDMSEYQLAGSVNKMIGDADGTLGYLTEAVRKKPFSLVLLDEIEKSHPDVLNLFLQMMDDGRLTDGQGRTINFTNSIIIATSNIGALYIQDEVNKNTDIEIIKRNLIENQINKVMRPELINRFDGVIVFKPLTLSNVYDIAKLLLKKLATNLEIKGISLRVSEDGLRKVAELGYDPQFGARPLRRVIQDKVENQIANIFLAGNLKRRDTVVINNQGEIEIEKGANL